MIATSIYILSVSAITLLQQIPTINAASGDISAISKTEWDSLSSSLSTDASLHSIQNSDYKTCRSLGSDAYALSDGANGICMHSHDCAYEFCLRERGVYDLPSYVIDARTEGDITKALEFATLHDIEVSVKTTGHSYVGSSTKANTLMIWMHNFPKDGSINHNYTDTCGTNHGPAIAIAGGEVWDDVLESVKDEYHVVTGGGRTVSAAGGWLQGGGLSFSSRQYGTGVDQALHFRVVLANGTAVDANACTNEDLFFSLRGGGGGTYGVVTHVMYQLHPLTTIVTANFFYGGLDWAFSNNPVAGIVAIDSWFDFLIAKSPDLDPRWSGFWNAGGAHLVFSGSEEDAMSTLGDDFLDWYNNLDKSAWKQNVFGALPPQIDVHQSWYDYKGGADAASNPDLTDQTGDAYAGIHTMSARLIPRSKVVSSPAEVKEFLWSIVSSLGTVNYFLGGNMNNVGKDDTAVHPALRNSIWSIFTLDPIDSQRVRNFVPNNETGICYNHHNGIEPDWRNASWGENYEKLNAIKDKYDPKSIFNCWHCVGYKGEEIESNTVVPPNAAHSMKYITSIIIGVLGISITFI